MFCAVPECERCSYVCRYVFYPCLQSSSLNTWNILMPLDRGLHSSQTPSTSCGLSQQIEGGEPENSLKVAGVPLYVYLNVFRCPREAKSLQKDD